MADNSLRRLSRLQAAALTLAATAFAHAGSIIDTNLPANTEIVNISGTNDGAAVYNGANLQSLWYQPFAANGQLNELTLQPGTYSFTITDPTDAAAEFPLLTSSQLSEMGGAWTFNSPWTTSYIVFDSSALTDPTESQLFSGGLFPNTYSNGADAYAATKAAGMLSTITTGPGGRLNGTQQPSLTITSTETLIFVVPDYYLPDNNGVESIVVQPAATPEPAPFFALGAGVLGLLIRRRNRK